MNQEHLTLKINNTIIRILKTEIKFAEIFGDCLSIHTVKNEKYTYCSSLKSFVEICNNITLINRNVAINLNYIKTFDVNSRMITLTDISTFEVSVRRVSALKKALKNNLIPNFEQYT